LSQIYFLFLLPYYLARVDPYYIIDDAIDEHADTHIESLLTYCYASIN